MNSTIIFYTQITSHSFSRFFEIFLGTWLIQNVAHNWTKKSFFSNNMNSETSSGYSSESNTTMGGVLTHSPERTIGNSRESSRRNSSQQLGGFIDEEDIISAQFNSCIRELFFLKFVQMFVSYEKFVIVPSNIEASQIDQWWMQREYSGVNFDSKMFLIEQPSPRLPFLSHFIATQIFVSFIDSKIISIIDPSTRVTNEYLGVVTNLLLIFII